MLTERVWQEVRVDTHRAKRLAEAALDVAQTLGSPSLLARSFRAKANAMYALDEHTEAVYLHEQAIVLFEQTGDEAELARTLSGSIQSLLLLGWYDQALAAGERAGAIFRQQGNTRRLARLEINIGNIYHRQIDSPRRWRFTSARMSRSNTQLSRVSAAASALLSTS